VTLETTAGGLRSFLASAAGVDDLGGADGGAIVVDDLDHDGAPVDLPPLLPRVVIGVDREQTGAAGDDGGVVATGVDVVVDPADVDAVVRTVEQNPQAATALAVLLRTGAGRSVADGLHAESAVYGVLQAGGEFAHWRQRRPVRQRPETGEPAVGVERRGDVLHVELRRPDVRNALDARVRDGLTDALRLALDDPSVTVELTGAGASFCSGGDLDEFGSRPDSATAHLVRLSRSPAWLLHRLADRVHVVVHGATAGSGVELPAFVGSVTARPGTTFALPEVALGLIPGAGGTVSIPRRIGRRRTLLLALLGRAIDVTTALDWGLVDRVEAAASGGTVDVLTQRG